MSQVSPEWKDGRSKDITFIVTKDCQLACKYCYLVGKNSEERMSWETAKRSVDYILSQENDELFDFESVVFNYIGGEPFLEIDLIDRICDYLKMQMYLMNHHWFNSYRFSITTNGINYHTPKVQEFIRKNRKHLSITITLDGTKKKHDINRVWKSLGEASEHGSYDFVVKNVPLWLKQFPNAATKVTISSPDIPYICESVLHLFSLGIYTVHINCVFENVWKDGDDELFEHQLRMLADKMLEKNLHQDYECSLFERGIGMPMDVKRDKNWCGAGLMLAIDASGNLYPCTRFVKYSLREKSARVIGHINTGIDKNLLRPFYSLSRSLQSTKKCIECSVATGCAWCQGENYDCSDTGTIFQRSTAICKMHQARVRANQYFWSRVDKKNGKQSKYEIVVDNRCRLDKTPNNLNTVIVLTATDATPFCISSIHPKESMLISLPDIQKIVREAELRGWDLQFVYPPYQLPAEYVSVIDSVPHKAITPVISSIKGDAVVINGWGEISKCKQHAPIYILRTRLVDFYNNISDIEKVLNLSDRLEIVFLDDPSFSENEEESYRGALRKLTSIVLKCWSEPHRVQVNLITDRLHLHKMVNCNAGAQSVTLAPNGRYYICPSFYYTNENDSCGDLEHGLNIKNPLLYKLDHSPLCISCKAYHCNRCVYLNKQKTLEVNIPSFEQCKKAELELEASKLFYDLWKRQENS